MPQPIHLKLLDTTACNMPLWQLRQYNFNQTDPNKEYKLTDKEEEITCPQCKTQIGVRKRLLLD